VSVLERGVLYGDDCRPLVMTPADSVDIDDLHDFDYAEFLLNRTRQ
jgi:CMP-N-acetylneuraminic acid synthetase